MLFFIQKFLNFRFQGLSNELFFPNIFKPVNIFKNKGNAINVCFKQLSRNCIFSYAIELVRKFISLYMFRIKIKMKIFDENRVNIYNFLAFCTGREN